MSHHSIDSKLLGGIAEAENKTSVEAKLQMGIMEALKKASDEAKLIFDQIKEEVKNHGEYSYLIGQDPLVGAELFRILSENGNEYTYQISYTGCDHKCDDDCGISVNCPLCGKVSADCRCTGTQMKRNQENNFVLCTHSCWIRNGDELTTTCDNGILIVKCRQPVTMGH